MKKYIKSLEADYDLIYIPNGTKIGGNRFKSITGKLILYMFQYIYTNDRINIKDNNDIIPPLTVATFSGPTENDVIPSIAKSTNFL